VRRAIDKLDKQEASREFERVLLTGQAADLLVELRGTLGLSQRELAQRVDVSESRISQVLAGGENLTLKSLAELGWAMGIRFELIPTPIEDRAATPAADDPPPPCWLGKFADGALRRVRASWRTSSRSSRRRALADR
jgi:transcriptional regulator with XRE-family HTH domain